VEALKRFVELRKHQISVAQAPEVLGNGVGVIDGRFDYDD
jgi:hypothetical protein